MRRIGVFPQQRQSSPYRADTSHKKSQLINVLAMSEKLWNEQGRQEQSFVYLRKGIALLDFIIVNQELEACRSAYIDKRQELKLRLGERQNYRYSAEKKDLPNIYPNEKNNTPKKEIKVDTSAKKTEFVNTLMRSQKLWNEGKTQESLVDLNIAILMISFIAKYEENDTVRSNYMEKLKELKKKLIDRE